MITISPTSFTNCSYYIENPNNGVPLQSMTDMDGYFGSGFFHFMTNRIAEHNMIEVMKQWYSHHVVLNHYDDAIAQFSCEIEILEQFDESFCNKEYFPNLYKGMPRSTVQRMTTLKVNLEQSLDAAKYEREEYVRKNLA